MDNFFTRMKNFGIKRIILSFDLIIPLIISIIGAFTFFNYLLGDSLVNQILSDIMIASISIATIVLAGFAIIISLTEKELVGYLKKYKIYDNIIFTFEYTTLLSLFTFIIALLVKYLVFSKFIYFFNLFLFIYLIACLIELIGFITTFGVKKGELYS